jgi:predicted MFS family arabinose efflux permease
VLAKNKYLPFLMWFFPLAFFTYQFIWRLWPGLMMQTIMEQFSIDASHFGMLAALYYYGYAGMQIPVAILLDRCSARYVIFAFALICGLSSLVFTYTDNWYLACVSRFLIGASSAIGFLGISKVVSQWFPKDQYARMIGFSFTIGLMGAIYGGKPINLLIENYNWQKVAVVLAFVSIAIGIGTYFCLRNNKQEDQEESSFHLSNFKTLLSSPTIWLIGLANLLMVGSLEGFGDVWGVSYLVMAYNLDKNSAAELISFIFIGMLFGGPLLALLSKKFGNYSIIAFCGFAMSAIFILLLSNLKYNWYIFAGLFFLVGVMCCYQVIIFSLGADLVKVELLGVTIAFLNCANMFGGSFFHSVLGYIMDAFWTGKLNDNGTRIYELESYCSAIAAIPICAIIGAIIISFIGCKANKIRS